MWWAYTRGAYIRGGLIFGGAYIREGLIVGGLRYGPYCPLVKKSCVRPCRQTLTKLLIFSYISDSVNEY